MIDVANKDKKCKVFKDDFAIEVVFGPYTGPIEPVGGKGKRDEFEDSSGEEGRVPSEDEKSGGEGRKARSKSFYDYDDYQGLSIEFSDEDDEGPSEESEDGKKKMVLWRN